MAVSGKTAGPNEIPYFLDGDLPPSMATVTKAMADRLQLLLPSGTKSDGRLVIVNSGAPAYKAMSGDATIDKEGSLQLGAGVVGSNELAAKAVTLAKLAEALGLTEGYFADAAVTSRKFKPTTGIVQATAGNTLLEAGYKDIPGSELTLTPAVASKLVVVATFGLNVNGGGGVGANAQGTINLDVADQTRSAKWGQGGATQVWIETTMAQSYALSLTAAAHTIKLRAKVPTGAAESVGGNCSFLYMLAAS
jgi:hypothetical protein